MHAFIVSDLHLGSSETRHRAFADFVTDLPADAALILNGDTANDASKEQVALQQAEEVLGLLCDVSYQRRVIWLGGNNDTGYRPAAAGHIEFQNVMAIEKRLFVCHGHQFLDLPNGSQILQRSLRRLLGFLHRRPGRTMHMADYLRRIPPLYRLACLLVAHNAVRFARRHGYAAITCGHTHHAETRTIGGIRYFNTGAWTEPCPHCLEVTGRHITLRPVGPRNAQAGH